MDFDKDIFAKNGKKLNILIVEDERLIRNSVKTICSLFFNNIDEAENGQDAMIKYQNNDYDIIITDLSMPVMTGDMLIREIRTIDKTQTICIMSKYEESSYEGLFNDVEVEAFFKKPLNYKELIVKLFGKVKELADIKDLTTLNLQGQAKTWKSIQEHGKETMDIIELTSLTLSQIERMTELEGSSKLKSFFNLKSYFSKFHKLLSKIYGLEKMSANLLEIADLIDKTDTQPHKLTEDFNSFNLLLAIFEDFNNFVQKVFIAKEIKDLHYFDDSMLSSIKQLDNDLFESDSSDDDDLELF